MSLSIRESIISIGSRMLQRHIEEEIHYDVMDLDELQELQENLLQQIWMLTLENDIYERYLSRQDPHSLKVIKAILEREKITRRMTAHLMPRALSHVSFRESFFNLHDPGRLSPTVPSVSGSRSPSITRLRATTSVVTLTEGAKIPIPHRIVMAKKEVEELKKKLDLLQNYVRKKKMDLKAHIDEIEIRINEIQEAKEDFEVEVVTEGVDRLTGKIPAERLTRFIEEWLKSASTILERLRLKTATVKLQIKRARLQLAQRKELGEMLHVIDFEKLKIENQDLAKLLEEKNLYVIDMKKIAGYYHLKLTQHKQKLNSLSVKLKELKEETMLKQKQIEEINIEYDIFAGQVKRQQKKLTQLLNFTENHTAPDILDFIKLQEEYVELEKSYKLLQRRRNIEKIIFEEYKKQTLWNEKN